MTLKCTNISGNSKSFADFVGGLLKRSQWTRQVSSMRIRYQSHVPTDRGPLPYYQPQLYDRTSDRHEHNRHHFLCVHVNFGSQVQNPPAPTASFSCIRVILASSQPCRHFGGDRSRWCAPWYAITGIYWDVVSAYAERERRTQRSMVRDARREG